MKTSSFMRELDIVSKVKYHFPPKSHLSNPHTKGSMCFYGRSSYIRATSLSFIPETLEGKSCFFARSKITVCLIRDATSARFNLARTNTPVPRTWGWWDIPGSCILRKFHSISSVSASNWYLSASWSDMGSFKNSGNIEKSLPRLRPRIEACS